MADSPDSSDHYVHVHATTVRSYGNDNIVICEKNTRTGENRLNIVTNPEYKFWITKPPLRNHNVKKEYELFESLDCYQTTSNNLAASLAKALNPHGVTSRLSKKLSVLQDNQYVYGADIDPEVLIKLRYKHAHDKYPTDYKCGALDIETSVVGGKEINVMTFVDGAHNVYCAVLKKFCTIPPDELKHKIAEATATALGTAVKQVGLEYATIMRDSEKLLCATPKNSRPGDAKYATEDEIGAVVLDKIQEFNTKLDEKYQQSFKNKPINIWLEVFENELDLITWNFNKLHDSKTEFVGIWNMGFDIPTIMDRIKGLGGSCKDIMCHPEVPKKLHKAVWNPDKRKKIAHFTERWDWTHLTGYTQFIDSMCLYSRMRHAKGKDISYTLDYIATKEIGLGKLKVGSSNHYTMQTKHFLEYIAYNIVDCLLLVLMEEKNNDISSLLRLADISPLRDYHKQTTMIKNTFYEYCLLRNRVPGTVGYSMKMDYDNQIESTGGNVLSATLARDTGISVLTEYEGTTQLHRGVCDVDVKAQYPSVDITFGTFKETKISTCLKIEDRPGKANIEEFFGNVTSPIENSVRLGERYFNLPGYNKMLELFDKQHPDWGNE